MSEDERPAEQPAVKTTIVGGRPPGPGKPVGPIPRGIEVLVKKAAVDPAFRRLLLETRDEAAREIGLVLAPAEAMMLKAAPAAQLEAIIAQTHVHPGVLPAFLGRAAAVMLVALGAGTLGCDREEGGEVAGIEPDRPPVERVEPPPSQGVRPDRPQVIEHSPGIRPGPPPAKRVEPPPSQGIRPDRLPVTDGSRPDRPEPKPPSTGETATAEKPDPATETLTVSADWDEQDAFRAFARGLKHLSAKLLPKHTFTFQEGEDGKIHIAWKTQEYRLTVPSNKVGDTEVVNATGPAADGLILTVWINKEPDQAERPQTLEHEGHWKTDLEQVQLLPLKTYLKYNLDYGPKAEKNLLTTFSSPQVWYQFHTAPDPSEAVTRGVRPDRPPTTKGIQPDRPPAEDDNRPDQPKPTPPSSAATTAAEEPEAGSAERPQPIVSRTFAVPAEWDETAIYDKLALGLKRLLDTHLPGAKFIYSANDDGQKYLRIEYKPTEEKVQKTDEATIDEETVAKIAPEDNGLLLTVWMDQRLIEADRPRILEHSGERRWWSRIDQVYVVPHQKYLKWNLHYGPKTDQDVLARFLKPDNWLESPQPALVTKAYPVNVTAVPSFSGTAKTYGTKQATQTQRSSFEGTFGIQPDRP